MKKNDIKLNIKPPKFIQAIIDRFNAFLDWIAPVVDWVGDQAERYKAASDAVPPPSKRWVHRRRINSRNLTVTLFLVFLAVVSAFALYLPNRPTYSELEHRDLTKFPKASFVRVLNGAYLDDINTWFADTFPARETFLGFQSWAEEHYGFRGHTISGDVVEGDEIPDTNEVQPSAAPADSSQPERSSGSTSESGETSSEDKSGDPSGGKSSADDSDGKDASEKKDESNLPKGESDSGDDGAAVETLGTLLVIKNSAYEYYNFVQDLADQYSANLNRAAEQLKGKAKVYSMLVPTSMDVCVSEKVRKKINTSDQAKAINYLYSGMSEDIGKVPLIDDLRAHQEQDEYLYFRTDHHWTAVGAYVGYENFMDAAGKKPLPLSHYTEAAYEGFTGSFYRETESSALASKPDTVYTYAPTGADTVHITQSDGVELDVGIIRDGEEMSASNKYLVFVGGDQPFSVIENQSITDGSSVLVIKDSFGNCFCPYLVDSYQYVYMIDYRSIAKVDSRKLAQIVEEYQIQDVLFLNNISGTRDQKLIDRMKGFIG